MDRKEKEEKKKVISERIDLGNGRYKDFEVDELLDLANHPGRFDGEIKTICNSGKSFCSDDTYRWQDKDKYTVVNDESGVRIIREYSYENDDGCCRREDSVYSTGRDILNILGRVFKDL